MPSRDDGSEGMSVESSKPTYFGWAAFFLSLAICSGLISTEAGTDEVGSGCVRAAFKRSSVQEGSGQPVW